MLSTDVPAAPDWAKAMIGRPLSAIAPASATAQCDGYADKVVAVYKGAHAGVGVMGWGWDILDHRPLEHVLVVDPSGVVVGAGELGGPERPDVVAARPAVVTTPDVGWIATAQVASGRVKIYGLTEAGGSCQIGVLGVKV